MTKTQYGLIFVGLALFLGLYFGFDSRPKNKKTASEPAEANVPAGPLSIEKLLADGKLHLDSVQNAEITALENTLNPSGETRKQIEVLKKISSRWYTFGNIPAAAAVAEQCALVENSDTSWSVTGALYYSALVAAETPALRTFCAEHAVKAFESAAARNTTRVEHKVNLALVYAENPPPDNPMKAVLMLRELESKHPDNVSVFNALGRLAIKTKQFERAIERLEKARALDPNNPNTPCLLAAAYEGAGQADKAKQMAMLCGR